MNVLKREKKAEEEDAFKDVIALIKKSYGGVLFALRSFFCVSFASTSICFRRRLLLSRLILRAHLCLPGRPLCPPRPSLLSTWTKVFPGSSRLRMILSRLFMFLLLEALFVADHRLIAQKYVKTAASITVAVLKNFLIGKIESTIDEEKKVTHVDLTKETLALFAKPEKISAKLVPGVLPSLSIPSGGRDFELSIFRLWRPRTLPSFRAAPRLIFALPRLLRRLRR